jgi:hypothetical protein
MQRWIAPFAFAALLGSGCATYTEDLNRGQVHYQMNDHERALAVFRALEPDLDSFGPADRARYAYLHGMTAYRMSQRDEARHWLAIARVIDVKHPGVLEPSWKERLAEAMADLDRDVWGETAPGAPPPSPAPGSRPL